MNYLKNLASIVALSIGLGLTPACKPTGEEGNGNGLGYDGGMPPPEEQCLSPEEFKETTIYSSTTICPGTYRSVVLRVTADDVTLRGQGVTLDGLFSSGGIIAENVSRFNLDGFNLVNSGGVSLSDVIDSTIKLTSYSHAQGGAAIDSRRGVAIRILGGEFTGDVYAQGNSYEIKDVQANKLIDETTRRDYNCCNPSQGFLVQGGKFKEIDFSGSIQTIKEVEVENRMYFEDGSNILIEGNYLPGGEIVNYNPETIIRDNIVGGTIHTSSGGGNVTIENNVVQNCSGSGIGASGVQQVNYGPFTGRFNILNNTVQNCGVVGVRLYANDSLVEGNIINGNPIGLEVTWCNNTIRNNDLRNNEQSIEDSDMTCNTYEGNLE